MNTKHIIITLAVLTGTLSWGSNQPAKLPLDVIEHIAKFVDQQTLQRLAQTGKTSGFTEIAHRENGARFLEQHNGNVQEALFDAAQNNYPWAIGYLIQHGAKINKKEIGYTGKTPLMLAALKGHEAVVVQLIAAGADVNIRDHRGRKAIVVQGFPEIDCRENAARFLEQHNGNAQEALFDAVRKNYPWAIDYLTQHGADVNAKDDEDYTALMHATLYGLEIMAAQLIQAGADINEVNKYGGTALIWAIEEGYEAIAKLLIRLDADISNLNNEQKNKLEEWTGG